MIEVLPYILVILGWHPDKPGEISFERPEIVFTSVERCEESGAQMATRMTESARDKSGAIYQHRCMAFPSREELDAAFEQLRQRGQ